MPTALIAEDEALLAAALQTDLAQIWPELQVLAVAGDGLGAQRQALALLPELCFLDIRMPGQSGLDVAQALAEDWPDDRPLPLLVFVTAYDQYALQAFDVQAVDYLVKPVQRNRLAACVARLHARLAERLSPALPAVPATASTSAERTLQQLRALLGSVASAAQPATPAPLLEVIQAGSGHTVHLVPVAEVLYFEAADKYLRVVTARGDHLIRMSLRDLMPQLDGQQFWQVHRALVVRAAAISTAQRDESGKVHLRLRDRPERLTASRLYAHLFKAM